MRKTLTLMLVLLLAIALVAGACGSKKDDNKSAASGSGTAAGGLTAQQIFEKAMAANSTAKTINGTLDAKVDIKAAASGAADAGAAALTQGPITVSGTIAADMNEPAKADMNLTVGLSGQSIQFGFRLIGKEAWINYMGQWYVAPPDVAKQLGQSSTATATPSTNPLAELQKLGIDPKTWVKQESVVGEETVAGVTTYHIKIDVEPSAMVTDLLKALQSPEAQQALSGSGLSASDMEQVKQMIKSGSLDLWVQKDNFVTRKAQISGEIAPPASSGIGAVTLNVSFTVDSLDQPVTVEAPAGAKPAKALEQQLQGLGSLFGGSGL